MSFINKLPHNDFVSGEKICDLCDVLVCHNDFYNLYPDKKNTKNKIYHNQDISNDIKQKINKSYSFFVKPYCLKYFENNILPHINNNFILVTHNSDHIVGKNSKILKNKFLIKWYGGNIVPGVKTIGLPIGLENSYFNRTNYDICVKNVSNKKNNLLYFNFNVKTNPERKKILHILEKNGFKTNDKCSWEEYIKDLSTHKYCLSPHGNGPDCHRTWEALYVGTIPILIKDDILYPHFKHLPILFINDYNMITDAYLENKYYDIINKDYNMDYVKLSYWKQIFTINKNM